jgi:hypothetical protein
MKGRPRGNFKCYLYQNPFVFSNGQVYCFFSLLHLCKNNVYFYVYDDDDDWFANRLWQTLDEPKLFITLLRFERKYLKKEQ